MQDGMKIAIAAGAVQAAVGLALQTAQDPQWQTAGQGLMLSGVAGVAVVGGVSALASKWQSYKKEKDLDLSIEKLHRRVSFPHSDKVFDHLHSVAVQGTTTLMNASENKKTAFMDRMQEISIALVSGQNSTERHQQLSTTVLLTLSTIALELGVSSPLQADDMVYVPKDNTPAVFEADTVVAWETSVAAWNTANEQDMSALFKPAPFNEQSTSQWTSGGSPSIG